MQRAMLLKEFRELAVWAAIMLLILAVATINLAGINPLTFQKETYNIPIPFVDQEGLWELALYGSVSAILLAMRQTVGESVQGTWLLLLHRSVTREWIIFQKMIAGLSTQLLITGLPLLAYAVWAAVPGMNASPFRWLFLLPSIAVWLSLSMVYLGAFLCGLREASWMGTRLVPLVTVFTLFFILCGWISLQIPIVILACLAGVIVVDLLLICAIVATLRTREFST